jgi:hypothetical protein
MDEEHSQIVPEQDLAPTAQPGHTAVPVPHISAMDDYRLRLDKARGIIRSVVPSIRQHLPQFFHGWADGMAELIAENLKHPNSKSRNELMEQYYRRLTYEVNGYIPPGVLVSMANWFAIKTKDMPLSRMYSAPPEDIEVP